MANLDSEQLYFVGQARRRARVLTHLQHAQLMLIAAGLTAFGIIAVAAAVMGTLL